MLAGHFALEDEAIQGVKTLLNKHPVTEHSILDSYIYIYSFLNIEVVEAVAGKCGVAKVQYQMVFLMTDLPSCLLRHVNASAKWGHRGPLVA